MDLHEELEKIIKNLEDSESAARELMEKAASEQNFSKAQEMKVSKSLYATCAAQLKRVISGKPAFGPAENVAAG